MMSYKPPCLQAAVLPHIGQPVIKVWWGCTSSPLVRYRWVVQYLEGRERSVARYSSHQVSFAGRVCWIRGPEALLASSPLSVASGSDKTGEVSCAVDRFSPTGSTFPGLDGLTRPCPELPHSSSSLLLPFLWFYLPSLLNFPALLLLSVMPSLVRHTPRRGPLPWATPCFLLVDQTHYATVLFVPSAERLAAEHEVIIFDDRRDHPWVWPRAGSDLIRESHGFGCEVDWSVRVGNDVESVEGTGLGGAFWGWGLRSCHCCVVRYCWCTEDRKDIFFGKER